MTYFFKYRCCLKLNYCVHCVHWTFFLNLCSFILCGLFNEYIYIYIYIYIYNSFYISFLELNFVNTAKVYSLSSRNKNNKTKLIKITKSKPNTSWKTLIGYLDTSLCGKWCATIKSCHCDFNLLNFIEWGWLFVRLKSQTLMLNFDTTLTDGKFLKPKMRASILGNSILLSTDRMNRERHFILHVLCLENNDDSEKLQQNWKRATAVAWNKVNSRRENMLQRLRQKCLQSKR